MKIANSLHERHLAREQNITALRLQADTTEQIKGVSWDFGRVGTAAHPTLLSRRVLYTSDIGACMQKADATSVNCTYSAVAHIQLPFKVGWTAPFRSASCRGPGIMCLPTGRKLHGECNRHLRRCDQQGHMLHLA